MEFTEINANTEEELLVQISQIVKEMTVKQELHFSNWPSHYETSKLDEIVEPAKINNSFAGSVSQ